MTQNRLGAAASTLHSFCGQIGNTIAFAEAINPPDVEMIYSLGPNMFPIRDYEYVNGLPIGG